MSLKGKVAVVTGGARGLGKAISLRLAREGAAVAVWDLNGDGAEQTAREIKEAGGKAMGCGGDASSSSDIAAATERTRRELGPISILVNNAAICPFEKFAELTEEKWRRVIDIDLTGPFLCSKEVIPDMLAAGWGRIVNISSSGAQTGQTVGVHYGAAKGGIMGLSKAMAMEFAGKGITVNNVPPGFVDTEGLRESPVDVDNYAETTPMKRPGKPEDIAAAVAFLASDDAGYITGHTLSVNGGRYCS